MRESLPDQRFRRSAGRRAGDALYVAPEADISVPVGERHLERTNLLGSYRDIIGWTPGKERNARADISSMMVTQFMSR